MTLLYTLSNILIPFSLLVFQTLKKSNDGQKPSYGKWLALFLLTFVFNGLSIWGRWWILLIDLALKCSLYFLPEQINQRIETYINHLHLEGFIQTFRNRLVNYLFVAHQKTTIFLLSKLRNEEAQQFKQAFIKSLNNQNKDQAAGIKVQTKFFENTGVNCTIITEEAVQKSLIKRELQQRKGDIERRLTPDSKRSDSSKKMKPQKQSSNQMLKPHSSKHYENKVINMYKSQPVGFGSKKDGVSSKIRDSFGQIRQSSNIIVDDLEELETSNPAPARVSRHMNPTSVQQKGVEKPKAHIKQAEKPAIDKHKEQLKKKQAAKKQAISNKKAENVQKTEIKLRRGQTEISQAKNLDIKQARKMSISPQAVEQVKIIEKLDVSISEYSDLFEDDREEQMEQNNHKVEQVCRVQAIVEIGAPPQSKLQIYYLQLYSNDDLRIMSLYNRQFQRHKLISITKGQNNYYELHFIEGTVNKRKVKFRGDYAPFLKYLQQI